MIVGGRRIGGIGASVRGSSEGYEAGALGGIGVTVRRVELSPLGCSGSCGLLMPLVDICGDCVAAQGKSDHDAVLSGGRVRCDAAAVEGAVEGVRDSASSRQP